MIRASALVALGMLILACGIDPAVSRELPVHGKQQQNSVTHFVPRACMTYGGRHRSWIVVTSETSIPYDAGLVLHSSTAVAIGLSRHLSVLQTEAPSPGSPYNVH